MQVAFTSLKRNYELFQNEYEDAILRASRSGWYILGPELDSFEVAFSSFLGAKHCIGVNSGTDALILAIRALGIGEGDEVIVPAGTYIASVIGITENGATPVFVDSNDYLVMDEQQIEDKITDRTKAILPVHMYGQACNMTVIMEIAWKHDLKVIEDCAQSHGATWKGQKTGTFGDIGCLSFYPTKPLGALGDAGALVTNEDVLAEKLRMLRNYGSKHKYHNEINGVNTRLDEIQASVLKVGLNHLDEMNATRIHFAERYLSEINNKSVGLPKTRADAMNIYHLFPILVEDRDRFTDYLTEKGIGYQIHYPIPPYFAECYQEMRYAIDDYPNAGYIAGHEVSLPLYSGMREEDVDYVIKVINSY